MLRLSFYLGNIIMSALLIAMAYTMSIGVWSDNPITNAITVLVVLFATTPCYGGMIAYVVLITGQYILHNDNLVDNFLRYCQHSYHVVYFCFMTAIVILVSYIRHIVLRA